MQRKTGQPSPMRRLGRATALATLLILVQASTPLMPGWQLYTWRDGSFVMSSDASLPLSSLEDSLSLRPRSPAPDWHITDATLADVTGDGASEWVLLVWRPWQDWPIQRWLEAPSPIAGFHDATGDSCHLILLAPQDGREIWAGSALPAPLLSLAVGDVDGDGVNELVTLEGSYPGGRYGLATYVEVWRWNGFGFTLTWRSPAGSFRQLRLSDIDGDQVHDIAVR